MRQIRLNILENIGSFRGVYATLLEVIFDFDFDPPVYQKTVRKACSKKKLGTGPTNFEHPSQKRGTCMKSVK
jgi:hypothetical protein